MGHPPVMKDGHVSKELLKRSGRGDEILGEEAKEAWGKFISASGVVRIEPAEDSCNSFRCDIKTFQSSGGRRGGTIVRSTLHILLSNEGERMRNLPGQCSPIAIL